MTAPVIDMEDLDRKVISAIFDPGAIAGAKGDRSLTVWQSHAVMFVFRQAVDEQREDRG